MARNLWKRIPGDKSVCHYCGVAIVRLPHIEGIRGSVRHDAATVDHKIPGGNDYPKNLLAACFHCNHSRGDLPYDIFLKLIREFGRYVGCYYAVEMRSRIDKERKNAL